MLSGSLAKQPFATLVQQNLRVPLAAPRGFSWSSPKLPGTNLQKFYAVVAIPLFHRFITEIMINHCIGFHEQH